MNKEIKIEALGDFKFEFFIEKAIPSGTDDEMEITGVASTINIDHDNERMSVEALKSMATIINDKSVPLRVEHQKEDNAICGLVHKAWVDERNQLWIKAILDRKHPASSILYKSLKDGVKLGLSVGGRVKRAIKEMSEATGKMVKTFYDVVLDEVSVTQRPANYDSWLLAKSIINKGDDTTSLYDSPLYKEFLFEKSSLDYMQSFAKSIPDNSWKKVDFIKNNENINMKEVKKTTETEEETKTKAQETETETKEKAQETETETEVKEKAEGDKKDETTDESFKSMVIKGMESLTNMIAKLAKTTSTEKEEETTIMETKTKAEADETDTETKTKAQETETETKEKSGDEETEAETKTSEKGHGAEYQMKSMKNLLKRMDNLAKATETETETKEKAQEAEDNTEETTEKSMDSFVGSMETIVNSLEAKFAKSGKSAIGLHQAIADIIKNDSEIQKSIKDMMQEKGFKKSVSMGIPYMRSKEGKMFQLTAKEVGEDIKKSQKTVSGQTFKDVYKSEYSSVSNEAAE